MEIGNQSTDMNTNQLSYQSNTNYPPQQSPNRNLFPSIAGILLLLSGIITIIYCIFVVINADILTSIIDISIIQESLPNVTPDDIKQVIVLCWTVIGIVAIFTLLGGILSLKKKLWGIALVGSIFGLSGVFAMFIPGILSCIAMILLIKSRKEFQ